MFDMTKITLSILLCLSTHAHAVNWHQVGKENGNSLYVDLDNLKEIDGFVFYSELIDFKEAIYGALSKINKFKTNCLKQERATVSYASYTGQMGKYLVINEGKMDKLRFSDGSTSKTMKFVCNSVK